MATDGLVGKAMMGAPLGRRVRGLRAVKGWNQGQLAREANVSPNTISNLERGGTATLATLGAVALALGTTTAELLADDVEPAPARQAA